ncbi:hypothetical protein Nepgr_006975 [Nepenthes gracilis]|uniref:Pyrrolo-quinoline quinone repeat domain-containing protein n=1 Tax=Nepenthes gracilis TaxID=150966 RepID=A0AAD3S6D0_NEPGR|nr:hypothetical protein Nepgr_006975 [Nepenthes gracilis]
MKSAPSILVQSQFLAVAQDSNINPLIPSLVTILLVLVAVNSQPWHDHGTKANWVNHGGDLHNRRYASKEKKISPETVPKLHLKWKFEAGRDITATPVIFKGTIYFLSWDGWVYAVKASDGSLVWKQKLHQLTGLNAPGFVYGMNTTVSRATPDCSRRLQLAHCRDLWPCHCHSLQEAYRASGMDDLT